jgi:cysteine desulfurase
MELYFAFEITSTLLPYSITSNPLMLNMSNIASSSLRQASRLCSKQVSSAGLIRAAPLPRVVAASAQKISRRTYVSETKKDHAQVNVETAIRADPKAFFAETGKLPENQLMHGTTANADAMMSPIAGMSECKCWILRRC